MNVDPYVSNPFDRKAEKKMFEDIVYQLQKYDSDIKVWVIGNIELVDTQLDMLVIKKNSLIIIEMKNYEGEIIGSENDDWKVKIPDEGLINTERNYFQQVKDQRFSLKKKIENIIKKGKLKKFKDQTYVFNNISAWLCFNSGSTYDKDQIPPKALNWFVVVTPDNLPRKIESADSNAYLLNDEEINELLDSLGGEPYVLEEDNNDLVKDKWSEIEENPDDWETAKKANETFTKIFEKTRDQELKLKCKHGMALTSETFEEALEILMKLFQCDDYTGFRDHKVRDDILLEYFRWLPEKEKENGIEDLVRDLVSELKQSREIDKLYKLFFAPIEDRHTKAINELHIEIGEFLMNHSPKDDELLKAMFYLYGIKWEKEKFIETSRKLLEIEKIDTRMIHFILDAEIDYIPEDLFKEILDLIRARDIEPYSKYNCLIRVYNRKLRDNWEELTDGEKQDLLDKIECAYQNLVKKSEGDLDSLYGIVQFYDRWNEFEKAKTYGKLIIDKEPPTMKEELSANQIIDIINIFEKIGEKNQDYSYLDRIVKKAAEIYPNDSNVQSQIAKTYEKRNQLEDAIECYEHILKDILTETKILEKNSGKGISIVTSDEIIEYNAANYYRYDSLPEKSTQKKSDDNHEKLAQDGEPKVELTNKASSLFESLTDLYFEKDQYNKAYDLCVWLENKALDEPEKYTGSVYCKIGDYLLEKYSDYSKEKTEPKEKKRSLKSLDELAISSDLEKTIDYLLHKMQNKKDRDSMLFYGPPGTGKTEIAKGIAGELGWDIIEITSEVLNKYIGETEKNIRQKFEKARKSGEAVIIIDELEFFGQDRREQERSHELSRSREILTQINKTLKEGNQVLIIGITNYIERVDPAIKRSGRFNREIKIGKPNKEMRKEIFEIKLSSLETEGMKITDELDLNKFANKTESMTGADIHNIVLNNIKEILFHKERQELVTDEIVLEAIESVKDEKEKKRKGMRYSW